MGKRVPAEKTGWRPVRSSDRIGPFLKNRPPCYYQKRPTPRLVTAGGQVRPWSVLSRSDSPKILRRAMDVKRAHDASRRGFSRGRLVDLASRRAMDVKRAHDAPRRGFSRGVPGSGP